MKDHVINDKSSVEANEAKYMQVMFLALMALLVFMPEVTLAASLQKLTTDVGGFVAGDLKKALVSGGGIIGTSGALIRGNLKLAAAIAVVAIMLSILLTWINGGMTLLNA